MFTRKRVLIIDNFDSFVHILADEFRRRECCVDVFRNDWPEDQALRYIKEKNPALLVLSPGPRRPRDAALCLRLLEKAPDDLPIFGVCLGLQCIVRHFGGLVERGSEVVHGKPARIQHHRTGLFEGIEDPMQVGRYHSLVAAEIPEALAVDAECDGQVMAVRHRRRPIWAVQFHPESILTPRGGQIIENLLKLLERCHAASG